MLRVDHDALSEESQTALIRLGTDDVIRVIEAAFPNEEWHWQLYASSVLGHIHSDEAIRAGARLLQDDSLEVSIRQNIAQGLVCQFSTASLETVGKYLDTRDDWLDYSEWTETLSAMRTTAALLQLDLPKLDAWQVQMDEVVKSGRASLFPSRGSWQVEMDDDRHENDGEDDPDADDDFIRPTPPDTVVHEAPRVGRNDPCPCGSGKKFKKCCLHQAELC